MEDRWIKYFVLLNALVLDKVNSVSYLNSYDSYQYQCGMPVRCDLDFNCPSVSNWKELELSSQREAENLFDLQTEMARNGSYLIGESEVDHGLYRTAAMDSFAEKCMKNSMTTDIFLTHLAKQNKCAVRNLLDGKCHETKRTLSLKSCNTKREYKCDENHPYRSYDGLCNNVLHPTWGSASSPMLLEMGTCYDDYVAEPRRSTSGRPLPNTRKVMADIQLAVNRDPTLHVVPGSFNTFGLFFGEFSALDMLGK
ncbi:uncharacterized protein LOC129753041 [Uranotaenia lowii]|uniref:uncharacterized protein LOC129753041 n=1 Tax=Uranotaenia lowii TaxID=190385 RepID=UPI002478768B|nr:uncharacterized protein LOC129753041 [Uranotaenia lowii]